MPNFTDGLIIQTANDDGVAHIAAKLTYGDTVVWANGGARTDSGSLIIASNAVVVRFGFDADGLAKYRARLESGDEKAHHQIIGRGTVGDVKVVGFPAEGGRVGLKPAAASGGTNVPLY